MSDKPVDQRLGDVADRLKVTLLALPAFRPPGGEQALAFDAVVSDLVDTLVEIAQAAAIDERSLILAQDLSKMQQEDVAAAQKSREQHDAAMLEIVGNLPFVRRLAS